MGTRPGTARTTAPAATVVRPPRIEPRPRPAPAPSGGSPWLYVALGGLVVALVAAGGYIYLSKQKAEVAQVSPTPVPATPTPAAATPAPTEAPPTPAPATAAPPPTFAEATGKGARRHAHGAGRVQEGRLRQGHQVGPGGAPEDPANEGAKDLVERALEGQKANERARRRRGGARQGRLRDAPTRRRLRPTSWRPGTGASPTSSTGSERRQDAAQREAQAREQREAQQKERKRSRPPRRRSTRS